jgi:hypothetical protein
MQTGELTEHIFRRSHNINFPEILLRHPGAQSVTSRYRNANGDDLVEVHYYALPTGSILPGMRPDPKYLFEDGVMYNQEPKKFREARLNAQAKEGWSKRLYRWMVRAVTCRDLGVVSPS